MAAGTFSQFVFLDVLWINEFLVGEFNPSEKYYSQIGNLPPIGLKIKNIWNHHLEFAKYENSKRGTISHAYPWCSMNLLGTWYQNRWSNWLSPLCIPLGFQHVTPQNIWICSYFTDLQCPQHTESITITIYIYIKLGGISGDLPV